jgi:hypothetical protein
MPKTSLNEGTAQRLQKLNPDSLTPIVRKALNSSSAVVTEWRHQIIKGDWNPQSRLVCRLAGQASADGQSLPWAAYLKVPNPLEQYRAPWHRESFHREARLFTSGILDDLPGGITAPRCLEITEHEDDQPWMWLEEVGGLPGREWPLELFAACARQFGMLQGTFLARPMLDEHPWLDTRDWFPPRMKSAMDPMFSVMEHFPNHPITANMAATRFGKRIMRLWAERDAFIEVMERLPLTLCHGDFNVNNFYAPNGLDNTESTMIIDWQYAGVRQIGSDLAGMIADSTILPVRCLPAEPREFMDTVLEAYCEGVQASTWSGDVRVARFAVLAHLAVPWSFCALSGLGDVVNRETTEENRNEAIRRLDMTMWRMRYLLQLWDEAYALLEPVRRQVAAG